MTTPDQLERAMRRVLWSIRPYLPDVVVIGGWVPQLYRIYGGFPSWQSNLSRTGEVDVIVSHELDAAGRLPLATLLEQEGFRALSPGDGAVWANDPAAGEKLELFVAHQGLLSDIGRPTRVPTQERIKAIALTDLVVMQAHTRVLQVSVTAGGSEPIELSVSVPTLGAYVVTKAATFLKRGAVDDTATSRWTKRAKDVVYIHDVMAAGAEASAEIERDIGALRSAGQIEIDYLRYAANNLSLLQGRQPSAVLGEAADLLAERDQVSRTSAIQAVRGFTEDLREMLER